MTPIVHLGIDIAKDTLEVFAPGLCLQVPGTDEGHRRLLVAADKLPGTPRFVCEASGGYERRLSATYWLKAGGLA